MPILTIRYLKSTIDIEVSKEDFDFASSITLRWDGRYVRNNVGYLHRLIANRMGLNLSNKTLKVDHIDNNPRNNSRENLRIVSTSENARNSKISTRNLSGLKGVSKDKAGKFEARILENKKIIWRKTFDSAQEAHEAYCKESERKYGDKWKAK